MKKHLRFLSLLMCVPFVLCGCSEEVTTETTSTEPTSEVDPLEQDIHTISKTITGHLYANYEGPTIHVYNFEDKGDIPYIRFEKMFTAFYSNLIGYPTEYTNFKFTQEEEDKHVFKYSLKGYANYENFVVDVTNDTISITADSFDLFSQLGLTNSGKHYFVTGYYSKYVKFNNAMSATHIKGTLPTYDLGKYNIDIVMDQDGLIYMPFEVFNDLWVLNFGTTLIFNGKHIFLYDTLGAVSDVYVSTSKYANKSSRSASLAEYTYNEFLFFAENIYGLAKERGFTNNLDNIIKEAGLKNDLLSTNTAKYERAMATLTAKIFYDGHSGYLFPSSFVYDNRYSYIGTYRDILTTQNEREINLMNVANQLYDAREAAGKAPGLEISGDTAFIRFDSFSFNTNYEITADVDSYSYAELASRHTVLMFMKAFKDIEANADIENVVVDISINGGGAADTLPWLAAFFTLDPSVTVMYGQTRECFETYYKVDLNLDEVFDEKDTYAGKYNYYLLTSGYSFSCANYFPTLMKEKGLMTLIGQKSGGGECSVGSYSNASTTVLRNSSNYHLGHYDPATKKFVGNDGGIEVDYQLDYEYYYDNTAIKNFIHNLQSA